MSLLRDSIAIKLAATQSWRLGTYHERTIVINIDLRATLRHWDAINRHACRISLAQSSVRPELPGDLPRIHWWLCEHLDKYEIHDHRR